MSIKKIVIGLTLSMQLASGVANANWGDVYYCQMTNSLGISLEGKKENYTLEKFQFKLDQTKNAMVFGSTGYFTDEVIELVIGRKWPSQESWFASDKYSMTYFDKGKLLHTATGTTGLSVKSADCEKF